MKSMTGILTDVREQRFELSDDAHRRHVFTFALDASLEAGGLHELSRDGKRVTVEYDDVPDELTHVARRVLPAPPETRP